MLFSTIDDQIRICEEIIRNLKENDFDISEIQYFLLKSLIVSIVSEFENYIEKIFLARANRCNDPQIINFVRNQLSQKFRSPDLKKINDTLGYFDTELKKEFLSKVENTQQHAAWDNIMKARHSIVHKQGILNITLNELFSTYPETKKVIMHLVETLSLNEEEIKKYI